jgi:hypothetical protein
MTELMEALRTFLVDEGYWAVVVSVVSVGGGGYLLRKARLLIASIVAALPMLVKDVMLKTLNVSDETATQWQTEIADSKAARALLLEKELADIELRISSPLLTDEQRVAYEVLKQRFIEELAKLADRVTEVAVNAIENSGQ